MSRAAILGIGQVSGCGPGVESLRRALAGRPPAPASVEHAGGALPAFLADPGDWKQVLGPRAVRRLDAFSRNSLLSAVLALRDSGEDLGDPARVGIVAATGYGSVRTTFSLLDRIIDRGDEFMSPMEFSISVHNAPATSLASYLDVQGPCLTVTGFSHAWPHALGTALDWLEGGSVDLVLAIAADEVHEVMAYALAGRRAEGVVPGETYVAFLLAREQEHEARRGMMLEPRFLEGSQLERVPGPVIVAGSGPVGGSDDGDALQVLGDRAVSYASLWGRNPTSDAMSAAAASLGLEDGTGTRFSVASTSPDGGIALVTVEQVAR